MFYISVGNPFRLVYSIYLQSGLSNVSRYFLLQHSQSQQDALHAKYNKRTCSTVVGDNDWGHLQLDATGFYILMLAQMITSGEYIVISKHGQFT